jgi:tol-pal system protein YbgF
MKLKSFLLFGLIANFAWASSEEVQASRANATNVAQLEEIKEQLKGIRGDVEKLQFENSRMNERLVKLSADMEYRFNQMYKEKKDISSDQKILDNIDANLDNNSILNQWDADKASAKKVTTDLALPAEVVNDPVVAKVLKQKNMEQEYQDAYSMLKDRDYVKARAMFQKFLEKYPESDLASSAYYWNGETYFAEGDYIKSAVEYLKGYQANIRGSRAPDNLLKLAKSLAKLDKRKNEACITLLKLKKEFPNAQNTIKKQMNDDIKNLKCQLK